jgi:hypothetical protein
MKIRILAAKGIVETTAAMRFITLDKFSVLGKTIPPAYILSAENS